MSFAEWKKENPLEFDEFSFWNLSDEFTKPKPPTTNSHTEDTKTVRLSEELNGGYINDGMGWSD